MYETFKRGIDVVVAVLGLILTSPISVVLAAWIRLDSPGPVLYRGRRMARGGGTFEMLKFRTMRPDADRVGGPTTSADDPRITRSGRFLRGTKLDELPQLLNVLAGDMSLVGPRPEVESEREAYRGQYGRIMTLRPGITDWASIWNVNEGAVLKGAADPHRAYRELIQPTKLALQLKYAEELSATTDLRIIFATIRRILQSDWLPRELRGVPPLEPVSGRSEARHDAGSRTLPGSP